MAGERAFGPKVTTRRSCFDCPACKSERYVCQGDSGCDVYCEAAGHKHIGDTNWDTPAWCPALASTPPAPPKEAPPGWSPRRCRCSDEVVIPVGADIAYVGNVRHTLTAGCYEVPVAPPKEAEGAATKCPACKLPVRDHMDGKWGRYCTGRAGRGK